MFDFEKANTHRVGVFIFCLVIFAAIAAFVQQRETSETENGAQSLFLVTSLYINDGHHIS